MWVGKLEKDDAHIFLTEAGAINIRCVRRLPVRVATKRSNAKSMRSAVEPAIRSSSAQRTQHNAASR